MNPGRPEKPIDWEKVDYLIEAGCKCNEIAAYFHMHYDNFGDRVKKKYGKVFTEYAAEIRPKGEASLRVQQYEKALGLTDKGDNTMLIWLGKQRLEQKEPQHEVKTSEPTTPMLVTCKDMDDIGAQLQQEATDIIPTSQSKD